MSTITRHVHMSAGVEWKTIDELAPDLGIGGRDDNGNEVKLMGLKFQHPDGTIHIYVMDPNGKEVLMRHLTGGVIMPSTVLQ